MDDTTAFLPGHDGMPKVSIPVIAKVRAYQDAVYAYKMARSAGDKVALERIKIRMDEIADAFWAGVDYAGSVSYD